MHPLDPYVQGIEHADKVGRDYSSVLGLEISYPAEGKYINLPPSPLQYEYLELLLIRLQLTAFRCACT